MIIEQIRYFLNDDEESAEAAEQRKAVDEVRRSMGLPLGQILVADPPADDGPALVWQCAYQSEHMLAVAESAIADSQAYAAARDQLSRYVSRIEIELYTADEPEPGIVTD